MPDLSILVSALVEVGGALHIQYTCRTPSNQTVDGTIPYDFAQNAAQQHAAIIDAAKAAQSAVNGVIFGGADKMQVWCGRSV